MFDPQPGMAQVAEALKAEIRAARLEQREIARRIDARIDHLTGITADVRQGVGAADGRAHRAIVASERKRKGQLPDGAEQGQLPNETAGR